MQQSSHSSLTPKIIGGSAIGLMLVLGFYTLVLRPLTGSEEELVVTTSDTTTDTTVETVPVTASDTPAATVEVTPQTTTETPAQTGANGTFTAKASYRVPHGSNTVAVTMTVTDGVISSVDTKHTYTDQESAFYINRFDASVESAVVGEKIDAVTVGRIGGASLTSDAFAEALDTIIVDAQS